MSLSRLPMKLSNIIVALNMPKWVIACALIVLYFILGMFLPDLYAEYSTKERDAD